MLITLTKLRRRGRGYVAVVKTQGFKIGTVVLSRKCRKASFKLTDSTAPETISETLAPFVATMARAAISAKVNKVEAYFSLIKASS